MEFEVASKQEYPETSDLGAQPLAWVTPVLLDLARHVRNGTDMSREALAAAFVGITVPPPGPMPPDKAGQEDTGMRDGDETPQLAIAIVPETRDKENRRPADPEDELAARRRMNGKTLCETPCPSRFQTAAALPGSS